MGHRLGTFLLVIGIGVLAWAATVYLWKDPFTTAYTAYEQRRLASNLDSAFDEWRPVADPVSEPGNSPLSRDDVSREARRIRHPRPHRGADARPDGPRPHP